MVRFGFGELKANQIQRSHNLSVALGGRFDVFNIDSLGLELEIIGAYANADEIAYSPLTNRRKYVHSGALLYNCTLFVRAKKFETLCEVGYRHIGLHQMFGAKLYGYTIPKLANLHSDQVYIGVGRTF